MTSAHVFGVQLIAIPLPVSADRIAVPHSTYHRWPLNAMEQETPLGVEVIASLEALPRNAAIRIACALIMPQRIHTRQPRNGTSGLHQL
jgi:hypothetical protein